MTSLEINESLVKVHGDLTVDSVTGVFADPLNFDSGSLTIDLSGVNEIDSAGLALLVYWKHQAMERKLAIKMVAAPNQVKSMIRISDLQELLD